MKISTLDKKRRHAPEIDFADYYYSPIGWMEVRGTEEAIFIVRFVEKPVKGVGSTDIVDEAVNQIDDYFSHKRSTFDLPLVFRGTDFQCRVWRRLLTIPFGRTAAYRDIAAAVGNIRAVRAVGAANGKNPISIIAPCHRVIGADGSMTGYGGGLWRKEWLLRHEGAMP